MKSTTPRRSSAGKDMMSDEEKLHIQLRRIMREDYPYLFDKRVTRFIDFLQTNYKLIDAKDVQQQGQVRANDDLPQASQSGPEAAQERELGDE